MTPLSRAWTWAGGAYLSFALFWAFRLRGGDATSDKLSDGQLISQAYIGLLVALGATTAVAFVLLLYLRKTAPSRWVNAVPFNSLFEDARSRSPAISWATAFVFAVSLGVGVILFGGVYSESEIHGWDDQKPLASGFWTSRLAAHSVDCSARACFALAQRFVPGRTPFMGVYEYLPYWTDGILLVLSALSLIALVLVGIELRRVQKQDD